MGVRASAWQIWQCVVFEIPYLPAKNAFLLFEHMLRFSFKRLFAVFGLTILFGVGAYFVAYEFNDGKMTRSVFAFIALGMSFPSLIIGGVMRLFRPELQLYFAITALLCILAATALFVF